MYCRVWSRISFMSRMGKYAVAVVGEWRIGGNGAWDFVSGNQYFSRAVAIREGMSFGGLVAAVEEQFGLGSSNMKVDSISYLLPAPAMIVGGPVLPPVCISSDIELETFLETMTTFPVLTLYVSLVRRGSFMSLLNAVNRENVDWDDDILTDDVLSEHLDSVERELDAERRAVKGKAVCNSFESEGFMTCSDSEDCEFNMSDSRVSSYGNTNPRSCDWYVEGDDGRYYPHYPANDEGRGRVSPSQREVESMYTPQSVGPSDRGGCSRPPLSPDADMFVSPTIISGVENVSGDTFVPNEAGTHDSSSSGFNSVHEDNVSEMGSVSEDNSNGTEHVSGDNLGSGGLCDDFEISSDMLASIREIHDDVAGCPDEMFEDCPPQFGDCGNLPRAGRIGRQAFLHPDPDDLKVGRIFANKSELQTTIHIHGMKELFQCTYSKSDKKRLIAECCSRGCPWRVYAVVLKNSESVQIRTRKTKHTCTSGTRIYYDKNATKRVIAEFLKERYAHGRIGPRAIEIIPIVKTELKVTINYMKAWKAKELAIELARGSEKDSYKVLATYMYLLQKSNPGTVYNLETTVNAKGEERFKYLFFALGVSIAGIPWMREVIIIDGTHITGRFKGVMLTASFQDANFQVYPVGVGIVDSENEASWTWFFRELSSIVPDDADLVFVSDRHSAIYAGLRTVYPLAHHGACHVHLGRNVIARFKTKYMGELVRKAATAYTVGDFRHWFQEISNRNALCGKYLADVGFAHWTQAYSPGQRYNIMSSNIAESLNSSAGKALDLPITKLVEWVRRKLMSWFFLRRNKAAKMTTRVTEEVDKLMVKHLASASECTVSPTTGMIFQVDDGNMQTFTVDLTAKTCTCKAFQKLLIPCLHAMAAAYVYDLDRELLCGGCYTNEAWARAYEGVIYPVLNEEDVDIPDDIPQPDIEPPNVGKQPGRRRKQRFKSFLERRGTNTGFKQRKCSNCQGVGHNKSTCKHAS